MKGLLILAALLDLYYNVLPPAKRSGYWWRVVKGFQQAPDLLCPHGTSSLTCISAWVGVQYVVQD